MKVSNDELEKVIKEYENFATKHNLLLNPDREYVKKLILALLFNEKIHGFRYCPCRKIPKKLDISKICPCKWYKEEISKQGHCHCKLFFKPEVIIIEYRSDFCPLCEGVEKALEKIKKKHKNWLVKIINVDKEKIDIGIDEFPVLKFIIGDKEKFFIGEVNSKDIEKLVKKIKNGEY